MSYIKPSLLIVVPTLDSYKLLPRLLDSLQAQTWPFWRVLFVDGPSSDIHRAWLSRTCALEPRCRCVPQDDSEPGIFGAMNIGFSYAKDNDWVLFWGSDDWAAAPAVFENLFSLVENCFSSDSTPDLIACTGQYVSESSGALMRAAFFRKAGIINEKTYRRSLFLGLTPPHQATLIGPSVHRYMPRYDTCFRLSADLDYFLRLGSKPHLCVHCIDLNIVYMSDAGISGKQTRRRLKEVFLAYSHTFSWFFWFPLISRYIIRILSVIGIY